MTFNPAGRPPRLLRFCALTGGQLAVYDATKNLLQIDREKYNKLDQLSRLVVEKTTEPQLFLEERPGFSPRVSTQLPLTTA